MRRRACGLVRRDGRVLLHRRKREAIWALPGGRVEAGESIETALAREFLEELGWEVHIGRKLWNIENTFTQDGVEVQQAEICLEVFCEAAVSAADETLEFRWLSPAELDGIDFRPTAVRGWLFRS